MKTLQEQRAELVTAEINTRTDAFPGSKPWLRHNQAEKALRAFDLAQKELAAQVEAERLAAERKASEEAMAQETGLSVEEVREVSASAKVASTPTLYMVRSLPLCWVASDETGALWLFDARPNGWSARRPYLGHRGALSESVQRYNAMGTGWPHAMVTTRSADQGSR